MSERKNEDGDGNGGQPQDLWPDLSNVSPIRTPIVVLKEQAALLGQKTKNIVTAMVRGPSREQGDEEGDVRVSFDLVAPALDFYHYCLFTIKYSIIRPYPVRIFADHLVTAPAIQTTGGPVHSEEELILALRAIFSDDSTVRTIRAMIAQSLEMEVGAT